MALKLSSHVQSLKAVANNPDFTFMEESDGRVVIRSNSTGAVLGINLQPAPYKGPAGPVMLVGSNRGTSQNAILPYLTANYNRNAKEGADPVSFTARTSMGATADLISMAHAHYQEKLRSGDNGSTWEKSFQYLLRNGSEKYGLSAQPTLPHNATEDIRRRTYQQVQYRENAFGVDESGKTIRPQPFAAEQAAIAVNLRKKIAAGGTDFIPGTGLVKDKSGTALDSGMTFRSLAMMEPTFNDKGRLEMMAASPFGRRSFDDPSFLARDPYKAVKAPGNPSAQNLVAPYQIVSSQDNKTNIYQPMLPGVITNENTPNYAIPNVLGMSGDGNRAYEVRKGVIIDTAPVPGSMFAYTNREDIKADLWAQQTVSRTSLGDLTVAQLASDDVSIEFDQILNRRFGEGRGAVAKVGTMKVGDREESVKMRTGAGGFIPTSINLTIPKWVNRDGEAVSDFVEGRGISSTDDYVKKLQKKYGVNVTQVNGSNMSIDFAGLSFASTAPKGFGGKAAEIFTGIAASIQAAGRTLGVSRLTGEMKNSEFLRSSFMGAMNQNQLKQYFEDFSASSYGTNLGPAAAKLSQYFNKKYGSKDDSAPLGVDMEELANKFNEFSGGEFKGYGMQLASMMYQSNIAPHAVDSPENARNLDIYQAGNVGGAELPISTWSSDNLAILRNAWERNMRAQNKKVTQEEITASFSEHFKGVDNLTGAKQVFSEKFGDTKSLSKLSMKLSKSAAYFGNFILPRRMEYAHNSIANQEFRSGLSRIAPEFAKSMNITTDMIDASKASTRSLMGGLRFAAWQTERLQNSESVGPATGVREISDLEISQMQGTIKAMEGKSKDEIMDALIKSHGADDSESTVWRTASGGAYMMNPKAAKSMNFTELGVNSNAVSGAFIGSINRMYDAITDDTSSMANNYVPMEERMNKAVSPLYNLMKERITGSGKYLKKAFSADLPSGTGGRTGFAPWLFSNEMDLGQANIRRTIRQLGFRGKEFVQAVDKAMKQGFQIADTRFPMPEESAIYTYNQVGSGELRERIGDAAYQAQLNPSERGFQTNTGLGWGVANAGDHDRDPHLAVTNMRNVQGVLETTRSEELAGREMTNERVFALEKQMFHSQKFRDKVSGIVGSAGDIYGNKNIIQGLIDQNLAVYKQEDVFTAGQNKLANKSKVMGIGYNPRLALKPAMAAMGGYSDREIATTESSGAVMYQPGLDMAMEIDKIKGVDNRAGVPVASMISGGYFATNKEGQATFHLGSGAFVERSQTVGSDGRQLTPTKQEGQQFDLRKMLTNENYARGVLQYQAMQIQAGVPGKGGKIMAEYSPIQAAAMIAGPGEQEELSALLKETPRDQWADTITRFKSSKMTSNVPEPMRAQQLLNTPIGIASMVRGLHKAFNNENADGTERIGGSAQAMAVFKELAPDMYDTVMAGAVGFDYEHRAKQSNLSMLTPTLLHKASRIMSGTTNMGRKIKAFAMEMIGGSKPVPVGPVVQAVDQLPDVDVAFPKKENVVPASQLETRSSTPATKEINESVSFADGTVMTRAEYEASVATPPAPEVPPMPDLIEAQKARMASLNESLSTGKPMSSTETKPVKKTGRKRIRDANGRFVSSGANDQSSTPAAGGSGRGNRGGQFGSGMAHFDPQVPDDPNNSFKSKTAQVMMDNGKMPEAIAQRIRGAYMNQMGYLAEGHDMSSYVSGVLSDMGIGVFGEADDDGEAPTRSMQERMREATSTRYSEFVQRLSVDKTKYKKLIGLSKMRETLNLALAVGGRSAGVTSEMMQHFRETANGKNQLGMDLAVNGLGDVNYAIGDTGYKNGRNVMVAQGIENSPAFQAEFEKFKNSGLMNALDASDQEIADYARANPALAGYARQAKAFIGKETSPNLPEGMKQLAGWAEHIEARDKAAGRTAKEGLLATGAVSGIGISLNPEDADKLAKSFAKLKETMADLGKVSEGNNEKAKEAARLEVRRAEVLYKGELANAQKGAVQSELSALQARMYDDKNNFIGTADDLEKSKSLSKKASDLEIESSSAQFEAEKMKPETVGARWGNAARRMLGGFGLMYAKNIFNMATEGLGYGMQERLAFDTVGAQASYAATGSAYIPVNQQNQLKTNQALYGVNNDPRAQLQVALSDRPVAREVVQAGVTGLSTWGYTQFAATQLFAEGSAGAMAVGAAALPLAGAAVAGSILLDGYSRKQDQQGLAYRQAMGKMGVADIAGIGMMNDRELGSFKSKEAFFERYKAASDSGASTSTLMNFRFDYTGYKEESSQGGRGYGADTNKVLYGDPITNADRFFILQRTVADKYKNASAEAQAQTAGFLARNGDMNVNDKLVSGIIADYELGGTADKLSASIIGGMGVGAKDRMKQQTVLQAYLANQSDLSEQAKEQMGIGAQFMSGIQGLKYLPGMSSTDPAKQAEIASKFGLIAGSRAGDLYATQAQTYALAQQAGITSYQAPVLDSMISGGSAISMSAQQVAIENAKAQAVAVQAQTRLGNAQRWMTQSYGFGNVQAGNAMYSAMMSTPVGSEWGMNRVASLDPMMLAASSQAGSVNLNAMPGMTTFNGTQVNANYAAYTDRNLAGNVTGLAWGSTSFRLGNMSATQMAGNIWGSGYQNDKQFDQGAIAAGVSGYKLPAPITMPDGSVMTSLGGQMGMQLYQQNLQYQQQMTSMNLQQKGTNLNTAFTYAGWKIDDAERAAAYQHQQFQFNMQEQGINRSVSNFQENRQVDRGQSLMQRSWTQQDWGFNAMQRDQSWGWKLEDFNEESRFMTGRQRRLAERQMKRETIVHNQEGDQIEKQKERQTELWALEDKRFVIQKKQFDQSIEEQRLQLAEARRYYDQTRGFENQRIALTRKHFEEELKLQKESMSVQRSYAEQNHKLNLTMMQLEMSSKMTGGVLQTITDNGFEKLRDSLLKATPELLTFIQYLNSIAAIRVPGVSSSGLPTSTSTTTSTSNAPAGYVPPGGGTAPQSVMHAHAGGGMLGKDVDTVGERGWEFSIGGNIIPHEISKQLQYAGLRPGASAQEGKDKLSNLLSGKPNIPSASFIPASPIQATVKETEKQAQPINIYIGNERIASFVIDTVTKELRI